METSKTRVVVRIRPFSSHECSPENCLESLPDNKVAYTTADESNIFSFDRVLDSSSNQLDVYEEVRSIVEGVLSGTNGAILTYGQTGSGKTHTLIGDLSKDCCGIAPRAIAELLNGVRKSTCREDLSISVASAEIYCERIFDLLEPHNVDLQIKQNGMKGVYVSGLVELTVANEDELNLTMQRALSNRTVSSTAMNSESSRSHCLFFVNICSIKEQRHYGTLCMVDLAGSERQTRAGTSGIQLDEGILINKSLSALSNVICALTDTKARHVPYRDSKLTRVLQSFIGGTSQTAMIVCCSPSKTDISETMSSLRFGSRARGIINTVQSNVQSLPTSINQDLLKAQVEIKILRTQLETFRKQDSQSGFSRFFKNRKILFLIHFFSLLVCFLLEDILVQYL